MPAAGCNCGLAVRRGRGWWRRKRRGGSDVGFDGGPGMGARLAVFWNSSLVVKIAVLLSSGCDQVMCLAHIHGCTS
jgi:hypothetical protein